MAKFGVLGPLTVETTAGGWVKLRGDRQRSLLATLLLDANRPVPVDRLIEALWTEAPPKSYAANLHTYVSRLRERLDGTRIEHATSGYRLRVDRDELDLLVFRAEAEAGRRAAGCGDPATAAKHLRRALAQWRGHPLADLDLPVLHADATRLEQERRSVAEDCADAELAIGRHAELVGELRAQLAANPLGERVAAQLMTALQRSGRPSEALDVYRKMRTAVIEGTGLEPGPELRRAHAAVLRGEDAGPPPVPVSAGTPWPISQLPPDLADFSGREAELDTLTGLLTGRPDGVPIVVLSGAPGSGKSTLAVRAAHRLRDAFPDGQLFVPLNAARDPGAALADLLRAFGVTGPAIPDDERARAAVYRGRLTGRRVLVVLDDAAGPAQARPLLPGVPGCAVLVTSRLRLSGFDGADRVQLGPLTDPEAGLLLSRLAGADRVAGEPADAARIAEACGNLPLALRIAGTRLAIRPHLKLGALADRLEDERRRLDELQVPDLQLRTSIALSYQALSARSRSALRSIARCRNSDLPAWAVSALINDPSADGATEELVEASLLEPIGADATGEPRYRLHDMVRVFGVERGIEEDSAEDRLASVRWLVDAALGLTDLASRALGWTLPMPAPRGELPAQPLPADMVARLVADPDAWFASERANLVTSVTSICRLGWYRDALLLMDRLSGYLWLHGYYADLRTGYEVLRQHAFEAGEHRVHALAEANLAVLLHARGQYRQATAAYLDGIDALDRLGETETLAWLTNGLADCVLGLGRSAQALRIAGRARELFTADGDETGLASVRRTVSAALNRLGRVGEAADIDRESLALARKSGDARQLVLALQSLSWSLVLTGRLTEAAGLIEESVVRQRLGTARSALARSLRTLGAIRAGQGERAAAVAAYREAQCIARELDEQPRELSCTRAIAAAWIGEGRAVEAVPVLRRCLTAFRSMDSVPSTVITLRVLAKAYERTGEHTAARAAVAEADRLADPRDANAVTLARLLLGLTGC